MTKLAPESPNKPSLSARELEALCAELDQLRARVMQEVGAPDARHIRKIVSWQRRAEFAGRALLFGSIVPPLWASGVALLALSKMLENMEIGHNVLHGQYDFMNDPDLSARSYEWDWACPSKDWIHSHNYVHHTFTNVVGKDRDVGYGLLRLAEEQPWHAGYLLQPFYAIGLMLAFEMGVAVHDLELNQVLRRNKSVRELVRHAMPMLRKTLPQLFKDYVAFPALAGPAAPLVFAGNLSANVLRNVWAFSVIFCGHFPDEAQMFEPEEIEGETRGGWYVRQILGSANVKGPGWLHVLSGHLSHQIEHHLFPDLPAPRYPEIAGEVEAICRRYGVPYNSAGFGQQLAGAVRRIARFTLPPKAAGAPATRPRGGVQLRPAATDAAASVSA
jgi:NADPH-dependent stearoyl-CoA 9-desaturase